MFKNIYFKRFICSLCISCALSFSVHANLLDVCGLLIRRNLAKETKDDLKRLDLINRMDDINEKIRRRKLKPDEVEIENVIRTKLSKIDNQIYQGQYSFAHRSIRGVFRKVEVNTIFIRKQQKVLDELLPLLETKSLGQIREQFAVRASKDPFYATMVKNLESEKAINAYIESSQKELRKKSIQLGNNYHEYKEVRSYLEGLLKRENCDSDCRKGVQNLLNTVGVGSDNVRLQFPDLLKNSRRPSMKQVSELIHKTPIIYETRLFKEIIHELKANLRDYLYTFVKFRKMILFVEKNLPIRRTRLVRLFNVFRDEGIRVTQFPKINEIIRTKAKPAEKLALLKSANSTTEYDEFLVTFKRRADVAAQENWEVMLKQAKESDEEFYERMIDAQKIAKNKGGMTLNASQGRVNKLALILGTGSAISLYFNFKKTTQVVEEVVVDPITGGVDDSDGDIPEGSETEITNNDSPGDISVEDVISDLLNLPDTNGDESNDNSGIISDIIEVVLPNEINENLEELKLTEVDKQEGVVQKVLINEDVTQKVIEIDKDSSVVTEVHFDAQEIEEVYKDIELVNEAIEKFEASEKLNDPSSEENKIMPIKKSQENLEQPAVDLKVEEQSSSIENTEADLKE